MPFDCRIGRQTISIGTPLRAFVKWEPLPSSSSLKDTLILTLQYIATGDNKIQGPSIERTFNMDGKGEVQIEFPTNDLIPGTYEMEIAIPGVEQSVLPEPIWVLSIDQYLNLA